MAEGDALNSALRNWNVKDALLAEGLDAAFKGIRTAPGLKYDDAGELIPLTFYEFVNTVKPNFVWHRHNIEIGDILQDVADGAYGAHARIVIAEPPRHGKTEQVSKLFPAYWLYRWPGEWVGLVTYVAELAYTISNSAQEYYRAAGGPIRNEAARHWETGRGGGMFATGMGGPITGKGANLLIIDDPVKNAEESQSEVIGFRNREWYQSTFYTREAPDAEHTAIIVMHTRWPGPGDLIGWLFEQEGSEDDAPEKWHVVSYEATKESSPPEIPATCTLHSDWRAPGEALCPARFSERRLEKIRKRVGPYFWASVYQQRPRPREGGAFKEQWFQFVNPADLRSGGTDIRYWDLGASESGAGGDPTAGVKIRYYGPGDMVILDAERFYKTPRQRDIRIAEVAEADTMATGIWGPQDPAAAGKAEAWHFRTNLEGFKVHTEPVTGDIQMLCGPYQAALEAGHVKVLRGPWNKAFIDEHLEAWTGAHDDQIWAAGNCYLKCVNRRMRKARNMGSYSMVTLGT